MTKRIQFSQNGGPEVLQWSDFPLNDPAPDEVQIENKAIGVNFIDTYFRSGLYPAPNGFPCGLGTEAAGVVVRTGSAVTDFKVGDRVVYACAQLGAYSEMHNVVAEKVAHLPDNISFKDAAAVFLKGLTVYYLFEQTYKIKAGETILFHAAAGGVGLIACQWAKARGVNLIGTVGSTEKAALAKKNGALATINYREEDIAQRVSELTQGKKVSVVYDSVGKDTWEASLDCLQPRGLLVSFGNASGPISKIDLGILNQKGSLYVTRPSLYSYISTREQLDQASQTLFSLIARGAISVDVPENQQFALRDAALAHQALESRQTQGSCLLIP